MLALERSLLFMIQTLKGTLRMTDQR